MRSFHVIIPLIFLFQSISIAETRETLWKKTFSKIFLKNIRKELSLDGQEKFVLKEAKKSLYYNSRPFSEVYEVLTNQESSLKAFEMRESLLSNKITFSQLLKWRIPKIRYKKAKSLVSKYNSYFQLDPHKLLQKNFFKRPIGKDLLKELPSIRLPALVHELLQQEVIPQRLGTAPGPLYQVRSMAAAIHTT